MSTHLNDMDNAFDKVNRVRCFNHTLQISAKTLIRPFNAGLSPIKAEDGDNIDFGNDNDGVFEDEGLDDADDDMGDGEEEPNDYAEDDEDVLADLDADQRVELLESTATVRSVVSKVCPILSHTAVLTNP
jgi:hypothetical protein